MPIYVTLLIGQIMPNSRFWEYKTCLTSESSAYLTMDYSLAKRATFESTVLKPRRPAPDFELTIIYCKTGFKLITSPCIKGKRPVCLEALQNQMDRNPSVWREFEILNKIVISVCVQNSPLQFALHDVPHQLESELSSDDWCPCNTPLSGKWIK